MVAAAKANGLRLIITLWVTKSKCLREKISHPNLNRTNNWSDYGGMDVYVSQITGTTNHDWFYTNEDVKVSVVLFLRS